MKKKVLIMMIMAVALMALPAKAQNYGAEQPNATFQSTSAMKGSGSSYSANPTLNSDGTASYNSASMPSSGPHRAKKYNEGGEFEEENLGDDPNGPGTPLGDAVLPLLLFAAAFAGVVALRKRKSLKTEN